MTGNSKIALLGGGGIRTPLLIHGLARAQAAIGIREIAIYDIDESRIKLMTTLGAEIARDSGIRIQGSATPQEAIDGASFVVNSVRVGGMAARAGDERIAIDHGLAGQETTGPGGMAMALRTVPVALEHARLIERYAPGAWVLNFTNPAGLITQALLDHSSLRVVGICDTPGELFHQIARGLGEPLQDVECKYSGLNHLGWVRSVLVRGEEAMPRLLTDDSVLSRLYPADLFDPDLIRALGLIPSEYLFFYYSQRRAWQNQKTAGASRGEEILRLNTQLFLDFQSSRDALQIYKDYLNRRNASYFRLEANAESAFSQGDHDWDPFEGATGYHRIAIDVMSALEGHRPGRIVVNVRNGGAIEDLEAGDVVETPCFIDRTGPRPLAAGRLPETVRGLTLAVKAYERLAIRAAIEKSFDLARLALMVNPIVGDWELSTKVLEAIVKSDPEYLGYLGAGPV